MADFTTKGRIFIISITFALLGIPAFAEPTQEKQALLNFITKINYNKDRVNWDPSMSVCNWTGVVCDRTETHICFLRLPGAGLAGQIPVNTIGQLTHLRLLSLRNNKLFGPVPADFGNFTLLTHLFLQNNRFSGEFPSSITTLPQLARLDISHNRFEGRIPASRSKLKLRTLFIQDNRFTGEIPSNIDTSTMIALDVSNNNLTGQIPLSLSKFPESSFSGNALLCGKPLPPQCGIRPPSPSQNAIAKGSNMLPTNVIVIINVICAAAVLCFIAFLIYCIVQRRRRRRGMQQSPLGNSSRSTEEFSCVSVKEQSTCELTKHNMLIFLEQGRHSFDLQSLLGASAEVLGKGSNGVSYKAEMDDGTTVAVKRLKEVVVRKKDFDDRMALLGSLRHENIVKLIAYYYCKDEKLIISDFIPVGSLSSLLHGSRGSGRRPLDWIARLKIGLTAARGLKYIHETARLPHGNVKSSNILVTPSVEACLSDYGMHSFFGPSSPTQAAGYKAPEVHEGRMMSFKSDVYSFGIVLLEMLTGKSPNQVAGVGKDAVDFPRWVQSEEEFEAEVFDPELWGSEAEDELVAVLQVAMKCVEVVVDQRPEMWEVVRMLEMVESGEFRSPLPVSSNGM